MLLADLAPRGKFRDCWICLCKSNQHTKQVISIPVVLSAIVGPATDFEISKHGSRHYYK
jgi:hypothetical protein